MVSLSISSAAAANLLQQQQSKPQVFCRISARASKLHCLPKQSNTLLVINQDSRPQVHCLDTVQVHTLENPEVPSSEPASLLQQAFFEQLAIEEEHRKPTERSTNSAARAIARCLRDVQQESEVDAYLHGLHFEPHAYTTAIQKLGHWNMVHQAFCLFQWLRSRPDPQQQPNVYIFSSLLSAMKASHDFLHFSFVMDEMRRRCIQPNLVMYGILIECYERQGHHADAMLYFLELIQRGFVPDRSHFKPLLWSSEKKSDIRQALTIFLSAKDILLKAGMEKAVEELRDTVSALCSRIICMGVLENKGPDYVLRLFEMTEASRLELSVSHYDDILRDCQPGRRNYIVAKYILRRRWKMDPPLEVGLCNRVMRMMGKEKKWWAALEVFEHMAAEGPLPDATSYAIIQSHFNILLKASKERATCRWSMQLIEKMEAHGIKPDQYAWDTTLVACALKVDPDLAVHVFEKMIEKGHQPNVLSYGALLSTLEKGGLYDKAEEVWRHMKRMNVKPNITAYTIMISVYGASQKYMELKLLLDEMAAAKVMFTLITYNTLITVCAKSNNGQGALEWMQKLVNHGFRPDATSYSQLLLALSRGGQAEVAKDKYTEARQLGLAVTQIAVDCLVEACRTCNVDIPLDLTFELEEPLSTKSEVSSDEPRLLDLPSENTHSVAQNGSVLSQSAELKVMTPS